MVEVAGGIFLAWLIIGLVKVLFNVMVAGW